MTLKTALKTPIATFILVALIVLNYKLIVHNFIPNNDAVLSETKSQNETAFRGTKQYRERNNIKTATTQNTILSPNADAPKVHNEKEQNYSWSFKRKKEDYARTGFVSTRMVSIVVELQGEMGNHLSKIAFARAVQLWAKEDYGINKTQLILRAQDKPKWEWAMTDTKTCFPNTRRYNFRAGNTKEVDAAHLKQRKWLGDHNASLLYLNHRCNEKSCIDGSLAFLSSLLKEDPDLPGALVQANQNISFPFLTSEQFSNRAFVVVDRYYDDLRKFFVFDEEACCKLRPDPDESVFHFRNFRDEIPTQWDDLGFVELSPNKTAKELFGHLKPGDKIAITTRIGGKEAQKYVSALEARGLVVRLVEGQSGVEDFCFLRSAKKELVGTAISSYVSWAAYLGDADRVRLYSVDSPSRRKRFRDRLFRHHNWTNQVLKRKISFELYKSEESEEMDAMERDISQ